MSSAPVEAAKTVEMKEHEDMDVDPCEDSAVDDDEEGDEDSKDEDRSEDSVVDDDEEGDEDSKDEDHGEDSAVDEDEEGDEDSEEDRGYKVKQIKDIKKDPEKQDVTLHVKVMKVGEREEKSGKIQFMATVADATSAVKICVREEKLFNKFEEGQSIVLKNVTWTGRVLLTKIASTATFSSEIDVKENVVPDAFGEGEPVPMSEVFKLDDMSMISLRGKIVKLSPLTKRTCYRKVLSYRQVKLKDDSGFVYVNVWGKIADQMELGTVFKMNSCRKRAPEKPGDPWVTTTPDSSVSITDPPPLELRDIRIDRYQIGTLNGIDVTQYMSCPKRKCYHYQLKDGRCESCQGMIPDQDQVRYGVATIDILTQKGNIHPLTVYWPQLHQLFKLFRTPLPACDKEIVKAFEDLLHKPVKYQACGIVNKFKL